MSAGLLEDASFNQSPAFGGIDLFTADRPLADAAAASLRAADGSPLYRVPCRAGGGAPVPTTATVPLSATPATTFPAWHM